MTAEPKFVPEEAAQIQLPDGASFSVRLIDCVGYMVKGAIGQAPGGFAQVEKPMLKCTAVSGLTAGSSFVNIADVGGVYNDQWVQAISRWVTTVYGKTEPLPRTGY